MSKMNRRTFLAGAAAATAATVMPRTVRAAAPYGGHRMGCQSYSFRAFKFPEAMAELKKTGLKHVEIFSGHVPPAPDHADLPKAKQVLKDNGITPLSFGVEGFTKDEEASRVKFDFAKEMGIEVLTANPMKNAFKSLDKLTQEYGIAIAIHNHGPGARYDGVMDTLKAVEGMNPLIGACVDTGHVIRSGEKPHEVLDALGDRVISMHLKDWIHGEEEQILGEGDINLVEVAKVLKKIKFNGPLMLEFELQSNNPVPGIMKGLANWQKAIDSIS